MNCISLRNGVKEAFIILPSILKNGIFKHRVLILEKVKINLKKIIHLMIS